MYQFQTERAWLVTGQWCVGQCDGKLERFLYMVEWSPYASSRALLRSPIHRRNGVEESEKICVQRKEIIQLCPATGNWCKAKERLAANAQIFCRGNDERNPRAQMFLFRIQFHSQSAQVHIQHHHIQWSAYSMHIMMPIFIFSILSVYFSQYTQSFYIEAVCRIMYLAVWL